MNVDDLGFTPKCHVAAGRSLRAIELWVAANAELDRVREAYRDRIGASELFVDAFRGRGIEPDGFGVRGAWFPGKAPPGWRAFRGGVSVPNRQTKAGRAAWAEMRSLDGASAPSPIIGGFAWVARPGQRKRRTLYGPSFDHVRGEWIIVMHPDAPAPLDAREIAWAAYRAKGGTQVPRHEGTA